MLAGLAQACDIGLDRVLVLARQTLSRAINKFGLDKRVSFPGTSYYLPLIYFFLEIKVENLGDLSKALDEISRHSLSPSLQDSLSEAVLFFLCQEALASLKALNKTPFLEDPGFISDNKLHDLGLKLIDGRLSGVAIISGAPNNTSLFIDILRDFYSKNILCFITDGLSANTLSLLYKDNTVGVDMGTRILPLRGGPLSLIYALNFMIRIPLLYGNIAPGEFNNLKSYLRKRIPSFILALGRREKLDLGVLLAGGVFDLPIISDLTPEGPYNIAPGSTVSILTQSDYKKISALCVQSCGIKVSGLPINIPVPYSDLYEGEKVKEEELAFEFGGRGGLFFELLVYRDKDDIEDGSIELFGPDISQDLPKKDSLSLALVVEVCGKKMQKDFEPVLERQLHRFINYASGLAHEGQRDLNLIRISRQAFLSGFRLKHLGLIIYSMLRREYPGIIDKAQVKLYTRDGDVRDKLKMARRIFSERDERLKGLLDEEVDNYYSCFICQSASPNHICIISPERPGMCGAYSWLDAKVSSEVVSYGWNSPIPKGKALSSSLGQWEGINRFVADKTNSIIKEASLYSITKAPLSTSGLFECILAVLPEANGVIAVDRNYPGMTPLGMDFSTLSDLAKNIPSNPGFMGIARRYILSDKFILAEGGLRRLVWVSKELKLLLEKDLKKIAYDIGEPDLLEKIADEDTALTLNPLLDFLRKAKHPALFMNPLL
ncbi:MAG: hypothetical protein WAQ07_02645 [Candidatus Omnitrophota bacterium]